MFSPHTKAGALPFSRSLRERAGLLADIAAADHRIHPKLLATTRGRFQRCYKRVARLWVGQQRSPAITTEGNEMYVTCLLISLQSPRHGNEITSLCEIPL